MTEARFCFVQDDDCHWYIIPSDKRDEWREWENIDSNDPRSWDPPEFAVRIDSPFSYSFTDPQ